MNEPTDFPPNVWVDGEGNITHSLLETYLKWQDSLTPEQVAEQQAEFSKMIAWLQTPEGQAESERLRSFYANLPKPPSSTATR